MVATASTAGSAHRRRFFNWRLWLMLTHRWMGIAIGLMFVIWSVSGGVLLYYGLPHLTAAERLTRLPPLAAAAIRVAPADAAAQVDGEPFRLRISMLGERPVYRFNTGQVFGRWQLVYADDGTRFEPFDADGALEWLRGSVPEAAARMTYDAYLDGPDLFTHSPAMQTHMPMHRIALNDPAGSRYYVSARTGETVMKTDRTSRVLGFLGYTLHTLFFLRQQTWWGTLLQVLSWGALGMALLGVVLGIVRFALTPRYRHRGKQSRSPYTGLMKWHHIAGLIFSVVVLTWAFSGIVSLNIIPGIGESLYTPAQIAAGARSVQGQGPRLDLTQLSVASIEAAAAAVAAQFPVKELEVTSFDGELYYLAYRQPTPEETAAWQSKSVLDFLMPTLEHDHRFVAAADPAGGAFERFPDERMLEAARRAMPNAAIVAATWLNEHDSYYYDTVGSFDLGTMKTARTLPVLRVELDDPERTWLYLTPAHGQILKSESIDRANRWGYYGLHGLDFAFVFERRPLWDAVTITLLLGVGLVSSTTLLPMLRRLKKHFLRLTAPLRRAR
jgi:hypothetical protein